MTKSKNKSCIGLLIDACEMRAVELQSRPGRPALGAFGRISLPEGLVSDGLIADIPAAGALLSKLLRDNGFSASAPIVTGSKNQNVLLRMASMPKVPPARIRNAVIYQAQQFIPVPVSELILDFVACGESVSEELSEMQVLLVGAKKTHIQNTIALAKSCGRILQDIDAGALAALRAVITSEDAQGGFFLMANVDHETVNIIICRETLIIMTRTVALSPEFVSIAKTLGEPPAPDSEQIDRLSQLLALDIQASLQYYAMQNDSPVPLVLLTGAFGLSRSLCEKTQELLAIPVKAAVPYPAMRGLDTSSYGTCAALALRGLEGSL